VVLRDMFLLSHFSHPGNNIRLRGYKNDVGSGGVGESCGLTTGHI